PAPDGRQVGGEQALDEYGRGSVGLRNPGRGQAQDQAGLDHAHAARRRGDPADERGQGDDHDQDWQPEMVAERAQRYRQGHGHQQVPAERAAQQLHQLAWGAGHDLEVAPDITQLGAHFLGGQPAEPGHGQGQADDQADQDDEGQDDPDQLRISPGLRGGLEVQ